VAEVLGGDATDPLFTGDNFYRAVKPPILGYPEMHDETTMHKDDPLKARIPPHNFDPFAKHFAAVVSL
jgi:hypothetical protein